MKIRYVQLTSEGNFSHIVEPENQEEKNICNMALHKVGPLYTDMGDPKKWLVCEHCMAVMFSTAHKKAPEVEAGAGAGLGGLDSKVGNNNIQQNFV